MEESKELDLGSLEKTKRRLKARIEKYAETSPYILNPNPDMVSFAIEGLARNELEYGYAYCTCKVRIGTDEDKKIICPCSSIDEEIAEWGQCDCALFVCGS